MIPLRHQIRRDRGGAAFTQQEARAWQRLRAGLLRAAVTAAGQGHVLTPWQPLAAEMGYLACCRHCRRAVYVSSLITYSALAPWCAAAAPGGVG